MNDTPTPPPSDLVKLGEALERSWLDAEQAACDRTNPAAYKEALDKCDTARAAFLAAAERLEGERDRAIQQRDASDAGLLQVEAQLREARADAERVRALVDQQAADEGLWFIPQSAPESYLMRELRKLHAVIEGKSPEECAIDAWYATEQRT